MKLGIIAAMTIEADLIKEAMTDVTTEEISGITFVSGKLGQTDAALAVCGIGKVFAALCTQTMILRYAPDCIINTGVGGTLTDKLGIGDLAISNAVVQHDMDTSALGDPVADFRHQCDRNGSGQRCGGKGLRHLRRKRDPAPLRYYCIRRPVYCQPGKEGLDRFHLPRHRL